ACPGRLPQCLGRDRVGREERLDGDLVQGHVPGRAEHRGGVEEREITVVRRQQQRNGEIVARLFLRRCPGYGVGLQLGQEVREALGRRAGELAADAPQYVGAPLGEIPDARRQAVRMPRGAQVVDGRGEERGGQAGEEGRRGPVRGQQLPAHVDGERRAGVVGGE